jgi:glycosyltransferase involved in cell wall biosynthesis
VREPLVVLDLTALDTDSRLRGFGRYVLTLARGLAALPESERAGLRLVGLTHLGWDGSYRVTDRLDSWSGEADVKKDPGKQHLAWAYRRRVGIARALRSLDADLLHLPTPDSTPLAMSLTHCKKLVTCHDLIDFRLPEQYLKWIKGGPVFGPMIHRRRYHSADHVLAISEETKRDLQRFLEVAPAKITRVYNAIDHSKWQPRGDDDEAAVAKYGLSGSFLLYVGDVDWRKNIEGMAGGLARAREQGAEVTIAFAGRLSEEKRERVLAHFRNEGVERQVQLLDYVPDDDLAALYRKSLAHLFVSRDEGFGLTVVEAMACGAPVITTHSGSLGEVAGKDALLVDPEDHAAIGAAIVLLNIDPSLRADLGRRGVARAAQFTSERQARETLAIYRRMVGATPRTNPQPS